MGIELNVAFLLRSRCLSLPSSSGSYVGECFTWDTLLFFCLWNRPGTPKYMLWQGSLSLQKSAVEIVSLCTLTEVHRQFYDKVHKGLLFIFTQHSFFICSWEFPNLSLLSSSHVSEIELGPSSFPKFDKSIKKGPYGAFTFCRAKSWNKNKGKF